MRICKDRKPPEPDLTEQVRNLLKSAQIGDCIVIGHSEFGEGLDIRAANRRNAIKQIKDWATKKGFSVIHKDDDTARELLIWILRG